MQPTNTLPDNLKSRVSRFYVASRNFKNDAGENVEYERLVVEVLVKGEPVNIEFKLDKKDKLLLSLADVAETQAAF